MWVDPQADAGSRIRRQILSAETPPKKTTDIRIKTEINTPISDYSVLFGSD